MTGQVQCHLVDRTARVPGERSWEGHRLPSSWAGPTVSGTSPGLQAGHPGNRGGRPVLSGTHGPSCAPVPFRRRRQMPPVTADGASPSRPELGDLARLPSATQASYGREVRGCDRASWNLRGASPQRLRPARLLGARQCVCPARRIYPYGLVQSPHDLAELPGEALLAG
jgi:hypothetical protein